MNGITTALLPIGIFAAALVLFGSGLAWARRRDAREDQRAANELLAQDVLDKVEPWAGSREAAWAWYRSFPIPALGGLTAEQLVIQGRRAEVLAYLEHTEHGGYA